MDKINQQTISIPETELVRRILSGEKRLFEIVMRTYNQRLYRIGMSVLGNDTEVEDAMQTAYINAFEHLGQFENRSSLATWLTRIMLNECLAQKKKQTRLKMELEQQTHGQVTTTTPAMALANKELGIILEKAVEQLPEKYRTVFILREIEEMSVKETSEALNILQPNVKARLSRAKTMLRDSLNGYIKEHVYAFHLVRCNHIIEKVFAKLNIAYTDK